jgi:hypothetical protein
MNSVNKSASPTEYSNLLLWKGLLWREWYANSQVIIFFFMIWFLSVWIFEILQYPLMIAGISFVYGLIIGAALGGRDVLEGSQEFSFSLPSSRCERYLTRLAVGCGSLLFFTIYGLLAIRLHLPQFCWSLFVDSIFTQSIKDEEDLLFYKAALIVPVAAFTVSFLITILAVSKEAQGEIFGKLFFMLAAIFVPLFICSQMFGWSGRVVVSTLCPIILIVSIIALIMGYFIYDRKEAVIRPPRRVANRLNL